VSIKLYKASKAKKQKWKKKAPSDIKEVKGQMEMSIPVLIVKRRPSNKLKLT